MLRPSQSFVVRHVGCSSNADGAAASIASILTPPFKLGNEEVPFRSDAWKRSMLDMYRVIMKLHAIKLLPAQKELGDRFVRAEFQRHKMANEKFSKLFYQGWLEYVVQLERGITSKEMSASETKLLNDEQKQRLVDLRRHVIQMKKDRGEFVL